MPNKLSYLDEIEHNELEQDIAGSPIEKALKLMESGLDMKQIPMDDPEALERMYNLVVNNSAASNRLAHIINSLDIKGHTDISDKLERLAFSPEFNGSDLEINPFADEQTTPQNSQLQQQQMLEPDPSIEDEELEDEVSIKDIDSLLSKLEAVMDAMGDDFDPDLLPIAKKIVGQLNEKLDKIDASEAEVVEPEPTSETEPTTDVESPTPVEQPTMEQTPAIANIVGSTIKLAKTAGILENANFLDTSQEIDGLLVSIDKLLKHIK